jgi:hypothetical protein
MVIPELPLCYSQMIHNSSNILLHCQLRLKFLQNQIFQFIFLVLQSLKFNWQIYLTFCYFIGLIQMHFINFRLLQIFNSIIFRRQFKMSFVINLKFISIYLVNF